MKSTSLLPILTIVVIISFLSLWILILTTPKDLNTDIDAKELLQLENSISSLEKENKELQNILHGLETGKLSPSDSYVLKIIRGGIIKRTDGATKADPATDLNVENIGDLKSAPSNVINLSEKDNSESSRSDHIPSSPTPFPTENVVVVPKLPCVLIVGGTDGSGTRGVVQLLTRLGVAMVSEDPQTYDIHADIVGGWPTIVDPVLQETRSLAYNPASLSAHTAEATRDRLRKLIGRARDDSHRPQSFQLAVGGLLKRPANVRATAVEFGFKAPVAMTLLPLWAEVAPRLMFLHVVRDGRDIAFSANQGPVSKFYRTMYGQDSPAKHPAVMSIRLWSDWNSAVHDWATSHIEESKIRERVGDSADGGGGGGGGSFDYMSIHTEDLVPDTSPLQDRFRTIVRLANWVGSSLDSHSLCCLVLEKSKFMGSHDGSAAGKNSLKGRYGKWRDQVRVNTALGAALMAAGGHSLSLFHYEGSEDESNLQSNALPRGFHCSEEEQCPTPAPVRFETKNRKKMSVINAGGVNCDVFERMDYRGGGFDLTESGGTTAEDCCRQCLETERCQHFTLNKAIGICFLKSGRGVVVSDESVADLVSGDIIA